MEGVLLLNKPKGITSAKAVEKVKRAFKTKAGHTGTLDPIATGLIIVLLGRATRFSWIFTRMDKTYKVRALLGVETDTYDLDGNVVCEREVNVSCEEVKEALKDFLGEVIQIPPPFSAKKVGGKRAYKLARKGITAQLKPVKVNVYSLELIDCVLPEIEVRMRVSSGTYVRSIIHDLGQKLSCGACVKDLVRESVGPFRVEDAVDLERIIQDQERDKYVIPIDEALSFLPAVSLNIFSAKKVLNGNPVLIEEKDYEGLVRVYLNETFIGVGHLRSGVLKPERLLPVTFSLRSR